MGTHPALQSIGVESQLIPLLLHPLQLHFMLLDLFLKHSMFLPIVILQVNYYCNKVTETLKKTSKLIQFVIIILIIIIIINH